MNRMKHTRMEQRALRRGWNVSQELKDSAVENLHNILADPETSVRDRNQTIKTIVAMESQNLQVDALGQDVEGDATQERITDADYIAAMRRTIPDKTDD